MADDSSQVIQFQAEVQQLLDIVVNALYTDKEIFVRELVSNASDALEKLRHLQLTEKEVFDSNLDLDINIHTDDTAKTITFTDYGIGMSREELVENIGTIAHSGSKKFLQAMQEDQRKESALIGQFGVGFYSAFMVAKEVRVYTHSWRNDDEHLLWKSDGKTGYTIEEAPGQRRGCKIVVELREDYEEFSSASRIKEILERYSNFVPFPIYLNGERVNTVEAIWLKPKNDVTDEQYAEFYKFIGHAFDDPRYQMHFSADAPIDIHSLLFVPTNNPEKMGMGQMDPKVSLYCKKVLIDPSPKGLLPEYLRFLTGVVDSADLPLNISRESMQDTALVKKLNQVVTKRFLKFLEKEASSDGEKYQEFYKDFSRFIKEGIVSDYENRELLAKLLRFESSMTEPGETTSLEDYLSRAKEEQKEIYYLIGHDRDSIESGPFLEAFKARNLEVIFFYEVIDEYVLSSLGKFEEKELVAASRSDLELPETDQPFEGDALTDEDAKGLCQFLKDEFGEVVTKVEVGSRLVKHPIVALNPDAGSNPQIREMMKAMGGPAGAVTVAVEINPRHSIMKNLAAKREENPELAKVTAAYLLQNALLEAGLLESHKALVQNGFDLVDKALA